MQKERSGPLERYLSVVEIVAASHRGLTLTEIAVLIDLPKPTVHRLVGVLQEAGALESDERHQRTYRIGQRMWKILMLGQNERVVTNYAQIVCDGLVERLEETCYIVRMGLHSARTLTLSVPDQGYRVHVAPGLELPSHAAASVKAILAYQPESVQRRVLQEPLAKFTPQTVTALPAVLKDLEQVRRNGFAVCDCEIDPNVIAYGCPVFLPDAGVLYSIGVIGPGNRITAKPAEHWVEALKSAAAQFGTMLTAFDNARSVKR